MQQCVFLIRRRDFHLFEGAIRSMRAECAWLRMQKLQARFNDTTDNCERLTRELDRRLEIMEELKHKVVDLQT
jgi:hypothetical protein